MLSDINNYLRCQVVNPFYGFFTENTLIQLVCFRSEYNALMKLGVAAAIYILTQLAKMLALATFFPTIEQTGFDSGPSVFGEILKATVDIADLAGLYFIINKTVGKPELKGTSII